MYSGFSLPLINGRKWYPALQDTCHGIHRAFCYVVTIAITRDTGGIVGCIVPHCGVMWKIANMQQDGWMIG